MGMHAGKPEVSAGEGRDAVARRTGRVPTQQRARDKVERILALATDLIVAQGLDTLRMSDLAARAGIPIGSLYQYFPDRTAVVESLALRFNAEGQDCVARELVAVQSADEMVAAMRRITLGFYEMYVERPAMRAIWQATQANPTLQALDADDVAAHAAQVEATLKSLLPDADPAGLHRLAVLLVAQMAAAVRLAITLAPEEGRHLLALFVEDMLEPPLRRVLCAPRAGETGKLPPS